MTIGLCEFEQLDKLEFAPPFCIKIPGGGCLPVWYVKSEENGAGLLFAKDAPQSGGLFAKKVAPFSCKVDVVLPVFHGSHGEDGCIQGLCELAGLPYAGPGVLGAALGMDKVAMKAILKENDINVRL